MKSSTKSPGKAAGKSPGKASGKTSPIRHSDRKAQRNERGARPGAKSRAASGGIGPNNRIDRLGQLLEEMVGFAQPLDVFLSTVLRADPTLGSKERQFLAEGIMAATRHWGSWRRIVAEGDFAKATAQRRLALLAAEASVGLSRIVSEMSLAERDWLLRAVEAHSSQPHPADRWSLPKWIYNDWVDQLGPEEAAALAQAMAESASLDLRVNTIKASVAEVLQTLESNGIKAQSIGILGEALRVEGRPSLGRLALFEAGGFEVQDLGSQLLARASAPKRGSLVVDFCAGAGGKTLALGALMRNTGRLYALDRSAPRLARLKPRLSRSGLSNVWPIAISGARDDRVKRLRGKADMVLVDAPCTGLGTLRRNPDLKWRQSTETQANLIVQQAEILDAAAGLLAPGGRLLYATCSTSLAENEAQVQAFLGRHPEFEHQRLEAVFERLEIHLPSAWRAFNSSGDLRLWPHRTETDGFYGSLLVRKPLSGTMPR